MNDVFFSLDQQLADKLVNSLTIPLKIDVLNRPKYFGAEFAEDIDETNPAFDELSTDIFEASLAALDYAEQRDEIAPNSIAAEDEELYNIASNIVNAYLAQNPDEIENNLTALVQYDFTIQSGIWGKIKKYAKKATNWLKKQAKKAIKIKSVKLEKFVVTLKKRPQIVISNPVKVDNISLDIEFRVTVKYEVLGMGGRISFSDNFKMPDTDLDINFSVQNLKYFAEPHFRSLKVVKYIVGFKVTIGLASIVNKMIKPMQIFDAAKYLPEIPWFEKKFAPIPPLGLSRYSTGISFGVDFQLKD